MPLLNKNNRKELAAIDDLIAAKVYVTPARLLELEQLLPSAGDAPSATTETLVVLAINVTLAVEAAMRRTPGFDVQTECLSPDPAAKDDRRRFLQLFSGKHLQEARVAAVVIELRSQDEELVLFDRRVIALSLLNRLPVICLSTTSADPLPAASAASGDTWPVFFVPHPEHMEPVCAWLASELPHVRALGCAIEADLVARTAHLGRVNAPLHFLSRASVALVPFGVMTVNFLGIVRLMARMLSTVGMRGDTSAQGSLGLMGAQSAALVTAIDSLGDVYSFAVFTTVLADLQGLGLVEAAAAMDVMDGLMLGSISVVTGAVSALGAYLSRPLVVRAAAAFLASLQLIALLNPGMRRDRIKRRRRRGKRGGKRGGKGGAGELEELQGLLQRSGLVAAAAPGARGKAAAAAAAGAEGAGPGGAEGASAASSEHGEEGEPVASSEGSSSEAEDEGEGDEEQEAVAGALGAADAGPSLDAAAGGGGLSARQLRAAQRASAKAAAKEAKAAAKSERAAAKAEAKERKHAEQGERKAHKDAEKAAAKAQKQEAAAAAKAAKAARKAAGKGGAGAAGAIAAGLEGGGDGGGLDGLAGAAEPSGRSGTSPSSSSTAAAAAAAAKVPKPRWWRRKKAAAAAAGESALLLAPEEAGADGGCGGGSPGSSSSSSRSTTCDGADGHGADGDGGPAEAEAAEALAEAKARDARMGLDAAATEALMLFLELPDEEVLVDDGGGAAVATSELQDAVAAAAGGSSQPRVGHRASDPAAPPLQG